MSRKVKKVYKMQDILPPLDKNEHLKEWQIEQEQELRLKQQVKGRTKNQEALITSILINVITFITGCAGTGKTYITCGIFAQLLLEKKIDKIIITRPQIEVGGHSVGYLPGSSTDKMLPYVMPILDALGVFLGDKNVDKLIDEEIIDIKPLGLLRGNSFKRAAILCDEMQNLSYLEAKTLLTRLDCGSRLVLAGDLDQSDIFIHDSQIKKVMSKLYDLRDEIGFVEFTIEDVQRAGIVRKILERL